MAGDWIPARKGLSRTREVASIGAATGRSRHEVVGWLFDFWSWADDETEDGLLPGMSVTLLASLIGPDETFYLAMVQAGWLRQAAGGLEVPNFDHWMGKSAKKRLKNTLRKRLSRLCHAQSATTGQDSTEQERKEEIPPTPPSGGTGGEVELPSQPEDAGGAVELPAPTQREFVAAWNAVTEFTTCREFNRARQRQFRARCTEHYFRANWRAAIERASKSAFCRGRNDRGWLATIDWFLRPSTVAKVMEGVYDRLGKGGTPSRPKEPAEDKAARVARERAAAKEAEAARNRKTIKELSPNGR